MRKFCQLLGVSALVLLACLVPSAAQANIIFDYGMCNPADGCDQSVNFSPANSGTTVIGDTNPAPVYNVFIDSLQGLTLHGTGSTVDTGVGGPGFLSILIRPDTSWAWGALEFQLDSVIGDLATGTPGLTFTAFDQFGSAFSFLANFPSEGNNGENQHYQFHTTGGEAITALRIDYDPGTTGNAIQDIHNIDVNSVANQVIPEPATLTLLGLGLAGLEYRRRRA